MFIEDVLYFLLTSIKQIKEGKAKSKLLKKTKPDPSLYNNNLELLKNNSTRGVNIRGRK